jgi:hypothetical protein
MSKNRMMLTRALAILGLAIALWAPALQGQMSEGIKAHVPFDFIVGETTLPAGQYVFRASPNPAVLLVRREGGSEAAMVLSKPTENRANARAKKAVFNRYGDQYFLSEVWAESITGRQLPEPIEEGLLARTHPKQHVTIAAK